MSGGKIWTELANYKPFSTTKHAQIAPNGRWPESKMWLKNE